jgi:uncharacterized protein (TIGR00255 family)
VISMTGFGHGELRNERAQVVLEIRSYNNRYLDVFLNLPGSLKLFEPRLREYVAARVARGKIELFLSVTEAEEDRGVLVDEARLAAYRDAFERIRRAGRLRGRAGVADFARLDGVLRSESRRDPEALWTLMQPLLDSVFAEFQRSRQVEGRKTEGDIRRLAEEIGRQVHLVEGLAPKIEQRISDGLRERFRELLGDGVEEPRILAETAVLLVKFDINEEIQRMKAHLDSLFDALGRDGAHGKRLDFVCQELGREINTIGSKSMMLEVDQAVIAVKDALEKVREQLRNVE